MATARRSCLSVPGSSERMLAKAQELPADEVVIDLEDSVVPERKEEARAVATAAVRDGEWGGRAVAVRINPLATEWGRDDVAALVEAGDALGSLVIPKVESPEEVEQVDSLLGAAQRRPPGAGRDGRRAGPGAPRSPGRAPGWRR